MKVIGITGGIASGKTTVAHMLAEYGFIHLDSDRIVHALMRENNEMIVEIGSLFPRSVVNGEISRQVLSEIVAKDSTALARLESAIHPRVVAEEERMIDEIKKKGGKGVVLDIPLLFETGAEKRCDVVIAVSAPESVAHKRAFSRAGMTEEKWQRLKARQLTDEERCRRADYVIPTGGTEEETRRAVAALAEKLGL